MRPDVPRWDSREPLALRVEKGSQRPSWHMDLAGVRMRARVIGLQEPGLVSIMAAVPLPAIPLKCAWRLAPLARAQAEEEIAVLLDDDLAQGRRVGESRGEDWGWLGLAGVDVGVRTDVGQSRLELGGCCGWTWAHSSPGRFDGWRPGRQGVPAHSRWSPRSPAP